MSDKRVGIDTLVGSTLVAWALVDRKQMNLTLGDGRRFALTTAEDCCIDDVMLTSILGQPIVSTGPECSGDGWCTLTLATTSAKGTISIAYGDGSVPFYALTPIQ